MTVTKFKYCLYLLGQMPVRCVKDGVSVCVGRVNVTQSHNRILLSVTVASSVNVMTTRVITITTCCVEVGLLC